MIFGDDHFTERVQTLKGSDDKVWSWDKRDMHAWRICVQEWNESHYDCYMRHVPLGGVVLSAGGNMGLYVRPFTKMFRHVYVFEPDWINFHALVRNNFAENVHFFQAALGSSTSWGRVKESADPANKGEHRVENLGMGTLPIMTIDSLNLNQCNLIQLDVEDAEADALMGAYGTIKLFRPCVIIEGHLPDPIRILSELGYGEVCQSRNDHIFKHVDDPTFQGIENQDKGANYGNLYG